MQTKQTTNFKDSATIGDSFVVGGSEFSFVIDRQKAIDADSLLIQLAGVEIPDGGKVFAADFANTKIDRHNEKFSKGVLDAYAKQINEEGITFNLFHQRDIPVGKVLKKATVMQDQDGHSTLKGYIWIIDTATVPSQQGIGVSKAIETGILKDVSVEVSGTIQYIDNPNGDMGIWEWFIDPLQPQRTEISGLALVQKGAQRGAGITAKSIGGNQNKQQIVKNMFKDKYFIGGKEYAVSMKSDTSEAEGLEVLVHDFKESVTKASEATTAKASLDAEIVTLKAEIAEARKSFVADVENYSKLLNETAPATEAMTFASLKSCSEALKAKHDAIPGDPTTTTKSILKPSYKL